MSPLAGNFSIDLSIANDPFATNMSHHSDAPPAIHSSRAANRRVGPEQRSCGHPSGFEDPILSQRLSSPWGMHWKCQEASSAEFYDSCINLFAVCKQM